MVSIPLKDPFFETLSYSCSVTYLLMSIDTLADDTLTFPLFHNFAPVINSEALYVVLDFQNANHRSCSTNLSETHNLLFWFHTSNVFFFSYEYDPKSVDCESRNIAMFDKFAEDAEIPNVSDHN